MSNETRQILLLELTKKLVICTAASLGLVLIFFFVILPLFDSNRTFITIIVFGTGLVGGFVSIQQRIHKVSNTELEYLSKSWSSVLLIPIYGGIFALAIHVIILSGIITSPLFPEYSVPPFSDPASIEDFKNFFTITIPKTGQDSAKMIFWAFCAGFSERLVPQIIQKVKTQSGVDNGK